MVPRNKQGVEAVSNNWRNTLFEQSFRAVLPRHKGSSVSAAQVTPQNNQRNVYMFEIKPMLLLLRLLGLLCYQTSASGKIEKAPILSVAAVYSLLVCSGMLTLTTLFLMERVPLIGEPGAPFLYRVVDIGFSVIFLISYLAPAALWLEHSKFIRFLSQWQDFQTRYTQITGKQLTLKLRRSCWISLAVVFLATPIMVANSFNLGEKSLKSVWEGAACGHSFLLAFLLPFFWYLTCNALRNSAKLLESHLDQCYYQYERLAELRQLWRKLSNLTRDTGLSMGLTLGVLTLVYLTEQTLCIFSAMYLIQIQVVVQTFIFILGVAVFTALLFLQCNAAENATEQVGRNVQEQLEMFANVQLKRCAALEDEMSYFFQCIEVCPPVISYYGFANVNRYLMTSLVAAVASYLIVLMQFEISSE